MRVVHRFAACCCLVALLFAGVAHGDEPAQNKDRSSNKAKDGATMQRGIIRSSQVIGMSVQNKDGKDVGTVEDVAVDLKSGDIRYAALAFGGFAGFNEKLFAVPWKALHIKVGRGTAQNAATVAIYDVSPKELENAPGFPSDHWPAFASPKWGEVDKYHANRTEETPKASDKDTSKSSKPGKEPDYGSIFRASQVSGMAVKDDQDRQMGTVQELVFDLDSGKIRYAALSYGGFLGVGNKLFAVPMSKLRLAGIDNEAHFVTSISVEQIKNAKGFDEDHWPNTADPRWSSGIDKYYGVGKNADESRDSNESRKR